MNTENLSTLKIHKLTQAQYDRELEAGRIDSNAFYLTPETQVDWNQNDETAPDYVKNRPFYSCKQWTVLIEEQKTRPYSATGNTQSSVLNLGTTTNPFYKYDGATIRCVIDGIEYVGIVQDASYAGNRFLASPSISIDTGDDFFVRHGYDSGGNNCLYVYVRNKPAGVYLVSMSVLEEEEEIHKLDIKYLPEEVTTRKPLLLDANLSDYYGGNAEAGDEALEAIKSNRQILIKVPNADGGNYTAIYSPVYMYQVPNYSNQYLYLFYLKDEKQDLSALLGQPAGTVLMPTYGELTMLLSEKYYSNPLES